MPSSHWEFIIFIQIKLIHTIWITLIWKIWTLNTQVSSEWARLYLRFIEIFFYLSLFVFVGVRCDRLLISSAHISAQLQLPFLVETKRQSNAVRTHYDNFNFIYWTNAMHLWTFIEFRVSHSTQTHMHAYAACLAGCLVGWLANRRWSCCVTFRVSAGIIYNLVFREAQSVFHWILFYDGQTPNGRIRIFYGRSRRLCSEMTEIMTQ